jgi:hypothetical protein
MLKTLSMQDQLSGIITKLMVPIAKTAEPRMSHAPFVIILSQPAVPQELLLISLGELFSGKREHILKLVYQYVKMMIIDMHNSKMRRAFSTKICWPRKNC